MTWIAPDVTRTDEPIVADERGTLEGFLEWQRQTLLRKCAGLSAGQLARWASPPSNLSLLGLVRHLTEVERRWFRRLCAGEAIEDPYRRADCRDAAFEEADPARAEEDIARLTEEWELARRAVVGTPLDSVFVDERRGKLSLRWIYGHMIEEYARHNGHADLLRERIDGHTGA